MSVPEAVTNEQVVNTADSFIEADDLVGAKTREIKPLRKRRKEHYDALLKATQGLGPGEYVIVTRGGAKVRVVTKERRMPITRDYLVRVLGELLDSSDKVDECATAIMEKRDVVPVFRIVRDEN